MTYGKTIRLAETDLQAVWLSDTFSMLKRSFFSYENETFIQISIRLVPHGGAVRAHG